MSQDLDDPRAGRGLDVAPDRLSLAIGDQLSLVTGEISEPVTAPVPRLGADAASIRVGTLLRNRYRLTGVIGRGGMADVYRGEDQVLRRPVAVKVFRPGTDRNADRLRFLAEVRTLAGLAHPHLVALYDGGQDEARPWCVMQLMDGGTLADLDGADDGTASPTRVAAIGAQIADGLAYIHERGIVHRDVKPSNVLLDAEGDAYLSDFGVAQMVDATRMTATGALLGTAAYLSPEQVLGRQATAAVDVYALALVLLEILTGTREFPGAPIESAVARLSRAPRVPARLGPAWAELLTAMTALEPDDRPDAAAAASWLRSLARGAREEGSVPAQRVGRTPDTAPTRVPTGGFKPPTVTGAIPHRHPVPSEDGTGASSWGRRAAMVITASPARSSGVAVAVVLTVAGLWQLPSLFIGSAPVIPAGSTDVSQSSDGEALTDQGLTGPSSDLLSSPLATNVDDRIAARQPTQPYAQAPRRGVTLPRSGVTSTSPSPKPSVKPSTSPTTVPSPSPSVIAVPPPSTGPSPSISTTAPPTTPPPSTAPPTTPTPTSPPAGGG
jgi:serine/threonine protein kinase